MQSNKTRKHPFTKVEKMESAKVVRYLKRQGGGVVYVAPKEKDQASDSGMQSKHLKQPQGTKRGKNGNTYMIIFIAAAATASLIYFLVSIF